MQGPLLLPLLGGQPRQCEVQLFLGSCSPIPAFPLPHAPSSSSSSPRRMWFCSKLLAEGCTSKTLYTGEGSRQNHDII